MDSAAMARGAATMAHGALSVAVVAAVLIVLALPAHSNSGAVASWADLDPAFWMLDRLAGGGLVVAGVAATWLARPSTLGALAVVTGLAWLAPDLVGTRAAADAWRSVALLLATMLLPAALLLVAVAAAPGGGSRSLRAAVAVLIVGTGLVAVGRAVTYVPFDDPRCWAFCSPARNVLALGGDASTDVHRALTATWGVLATAGWGGLALWSAARWRRVGRRTSAAIRSILAGAIVLGAASAAWTVAGLLTRSDPPSPYGDGPLLAPLWLARACGILLLALGVAGIVVGAMRRRHAIRSAVAALAAIPAPGRLEAALAAALGDPALTVRYILDEGARMVDAGGAAVASRPLAPGRAITAIERGGEPVAIVDHDASLGGPWLIREIGAAARLAVDNERLRAAVLARVADLRASRQRIVEVADAERRRLERDLHDGAQQRLLALSFEIRVALRMSRQAGDAALAARLERADARAQAAIAELRRLAHGIHPAILRDTGLGPALATLADDAPIPMELDLRYHGRCREPAEVTVYHVVADALDGASHARASHLAVRLDQVDGALVLEIDDDGAEGPDAPLRTEDRVGAIGGRLAWAPSPTGTGRRLRAELPCA